MINKNQDDKGSTKNSKGILRLPEFIHANKLTACEVTS